MKRNLYFNFMNVDTKILTKMLKFVLFFFFLQTSPVESFVYSSSIFLVSP